MTGGDSSVFRDLRTLFGAGATADLTDGQLLDRFGARRGEEAEAAFEGLVARHGPMVRGICRRVLRDPADVDDAFQAAFLILASRAGSIRDRGSLGGWLARVALRVATRAGARASRRRAAESRAGSAEAREPDGSPDRAEIRSAVDEEVDRLPDRYRRPVVLCYLEGLTHDEAARQLRCPVGTVRSRLSRARDRLKGRLARRGLAPEVGLLAPSALPRAAIEAATRAALRPSAASATAATLKGEILMTMLRDRWRWAGLLLAACGTAAGAGAFAGLPRSQGPAQPAPEKAGIASDAPSRPVEAGTMKMEALTDGPCSVAFAPDGRTVAAGCADGTVKLWDEATGAKRATLQGQKGYVLSVAFSPDGRSLAGAFDGNLVKLWDPTSGALKRELPGFIEPTLTLTSVAFAPDGRTLAIAGTGRPPKGLTERGPIFEVRLLDVGTGRTAWAHMGRSEKTQSVTFSPDGRTLAGAGGPVVRVWDARTGEPGPTFQVDRGEVLDVASSPDGSTLAGGGYHRGDGPFVGRVTLWDPRTGAVLRTLDVPRAIRAVAFSPDGKSLAAGGLGPVRQFQVDGVQWEKVVSEVRLWDLASGDLRWTAEGGLGSVHSIAFAPDGRTLVRSDDETLVQLDARTGKVLRTLMTRTIRLP